MTDAVSPTRIVWGGRGAQDRASGLQNDSRGPYFLSNFDALFRTTPSYLFTDVRQKRMYSNQHFMQFASRNDQKRRQEIVIFAQILDMF